MVSYDMHVQWVVFYTIVLLTELLCSGGCIDTGGSTLMHISLVYLLIEFFVVGVVLYRGFGRSGGKRFSGWVYKRSSGWFSGRSSRWFSGRSSLGPKNYGVGLGS